MFSLNVISLGKGKVLSAVKKGDVIEVALKEKGAVVKKTLDLATYTLGYADDKTLTRGSDCVLFEGFKVVMTGEPEVQDDSL